MRHREKVEIVMVVLAVYIAVFTMGLHGCSERLVTISGTLTDMGRTCS